MISRLLFIALYITVSVFAVAIAQQQKSLPAIKVNKAPKIDGVLNDDAWKNAPEANNFIVGQPKFGDTATKKTIVKIVYDNDAVYIGAHLFDDPKLIRKQLTARDNEDNQDADLFGVVFDTYNDKQNGFLFIVTSANVQTDAKISSNKTIDNSGNNNNNNNSGVDPSWDAVWDSKVSIVEDGWIVEMKIPYMSLRFSKNAVQDWGLNFYRKVRRLNETNFWNPINPQVAGIVNQSGLLKGLSDLMPPLRLSFLPYISSGYSSIPTNNGTVNNFLHNGGMDLKYGINQSFTLDMTLIPDFGQTQSDNVVLNLTPYEIQFQENRPFFTEGTELFNKAGIFYSRRVGRTPTYYDSITQLVSDSNYTMIKNPSLTQLYNGVKFSGRTSSNLGIGIFNAVTAEENAEYVDRQGKYVRVQTEPFSNYNILVLDKALKNRSSLTFTNTNVLRRGGERSANVSALDLSLFDPKNTYNFQAKGRFSSVSGSDAHNGFKTGLTVAKVSGIWQWNFTNNVSSYRYDPNDMGYLRNTNETVTSFNIAFNQFAPDKHFVFRNYNVSISYKTLYKPFAFREIDVRGSFLHVFKNFWDLSAEFEGSPTVQYDYYELRTEGRKMQRWPWTFGGLFGGTDSRKKLYIRSGIGYAISFNWPEYLPFYFVNGSIRYRFNEKFSLSFFARKEFDPAETGWVYFEPVTNEPVIGKRRVERVESILSGVYNFKARMNLTLRVRHFWSKVHYVNFYHVAEDGNFLDHGITFQPGYDDNYNAFNVDAFYAWDFKPGSRFIVSWKTAMSPDASVDGYEYKNYFRNLSQTILSPQSQQLTFKFIYFVDYNRLRKKKAV
jgi:hypothetical protein